jgi:hypothetical protein
MVNTLLVVIIALQSATLIALGIVAVVYIRKTNEAVSDFTRAASDIRDSILPVAEDLRRAVNNTDALVISAKTAVDSMVRLSGSLSRIVEISRLVSVAEKAVTSPKTSVTTIVDGIKAGLHALRGARGNSKEGSEDGEQRG